jgi:hypothetical protein
MSAVTPIADKRSCGRIVRLVPKAEVACWFQKNREATNRGGLVSGFPHKGTRLLLARIIRWIDVIDAAWPDKLNLENPFFVSGPSVMRMPCRIHPQRARL